MLHESIDLIAQYGVPVPGYRLARTADESVRAWRELPGPVAMKVNRPHVSHKTEGGFVRLGCNGEEEIRETFARFEAALAPAEVEVLVQPMVDWGRGVILCGKQDQVFGPVILFGMGGILVEALGDVVWRVAPVNRPVARAMIDQIKGRKILGGLRGEDPCDLSSLEELLVRLSQLLVDLPMIREIDLNPVRVGPVDRGVQALDARVVLEHPPAA